MSFCLLLFCFGYIVIESTTVYLFGMMAHAYSLSPGLEA